METYLSNSILDKTIKIANNSNVKRAKVCAIAFNNRGHLISYANNRRVEGHKRIFTEHAEQNLIRKLRKIKAFSRFGHIVIFILRINSHGLALSMPCKRCQQILQQYSNKITVFYSDNNKFKKLKL
jgi:cytidine deaminase